MMKYLALFFYYSFFCFLLVSSTPLCGRVFEFLRQKICSRIFLELKSHANIEQYAHFGTGFKIKIGTYSSIGKNCKVPNNIQIGDYVMMGNNVTIFSSTHNFEKIDVPMLKQGISSRKEPFIMEDDVWIGQDVIIMPKVTRLAKGTIVGAGSIETKDFPEYSIIAGNPARLIRRRA